ncbi:MAG: hypothetical protein KGJ57_17335 [Sphingomonadales bacterium]|nr:hypothetical protein [Sphingomonadales bacterium]MDE2171161.1 hypothetical protein [Sphingomonadales bacterium]
MLNLTPLIEEQAQAELAKVEAAAAPVVADFKALLATRAGDLLIAALVLAGVFIGHAL